MDLLIDELRRAAALTPVCDGNRCLLLLAASKLEELGDLVVGGDALLVADLRKLVRYLLEFGNEMARSTSHWVDPLERLDELRAVAEKLGALK